MIERRPVRLIVLHCLQQSCFPSAPPYSVLLARSNGRLLGPLLDAADDMKPGTARLLRLLCRPLFHSRAYTRRVRIARGAYAEVIML